MFLIWRRESQQFGDRLRCGLVYGGANRQLHRLQIQMAALVPVVEDSLELLG